ncbi:TonB-dependent receptor domain-containing protein [Marinicella sp. W31]|uniref:TonB-dependent receptor domain-containing protein n=1 Tax=Marinicella sp. W31 TaxID=3023713 RepID=UPI003757FC32
MFFFKSFRLGLICALFFSSFVAVSRDSGVEADEQPLMVVTASRKLQPVTHVISSISVIESAEILALQAIDVIDVLQLQTGVDVARNGGPGTAASVFLRGTNSDQVLVLIDGVNVSSNVTGSFAWENLPASQIERIEIIRGPKASIYGSDAVGGVIQIFTRQSSRFEASYTTGSFDTQNLGLSWGLAFDEGYFSAVLGSQKTDGFSASNSAGFAFNPDDDGFENLSANIQGETRVGRATVGIKYLHTKGDVDFDQGNSDSENINLSLYYDAPLARGWQHRLQLSAHTSELETAVFNSLFDSNRTEVNWVFQRPIDIASDYSHDWTVGLQWTRDEATIPVAEGAISGSFLDSDRRNTALFGQWQTFIEQHQLSVAARYDDNDAYGSEVTGDLGWSYDWGSGHRLKALLGTAFKSPNLSELFTQAFGGATFFGNPDLEPEQSRNLELGYVYQQGAHVFETSIFQNQIDDLIEFSFNADFTEGTYFNVDEAEISGLELSYQWQSNAWLLNTNSTWQNPVNTTAGSSERLLRRPKFKWNLSVSRAFGDFSVGSQIRYASERADFGGALDDYLTVDMTADWRINDDWQLGLKLINLSDEEYEFARGFNTMPTAGFLNLRWQL